MRDEDYFNAKTMGDEQNALLANRYCVIRQLGQGGMGSVWLAEDTQLDNRPVAIKMLPSVLVSNKRAYNQLKAEALVSLKLTHSNIATVRAFEENNGNPFLVVDYIDGITLDDYLAERCVAMAPSPSGGGLPEAEVIRLLTPIAAALDYAHTKGVIHRDVKPGNVMIAKDGTPYILDFGIAREIQETLTRVTGKLSSGTLTYMSPEQLNGDLPTPAQDIYSFAAMAYECLTGAPPFSRGNIEFQIMNKEPAPLGSDIASAHGVMAGLAKTPESRPASCSAVLAMVGTDRTTVTTEDGSARTPYPPSEASSEGDALRGAAPQTSSTPLGGSRSVATAAAVGGVQLWENGPYWAECNVGASKPEEAGYYFSWGGTEGYRRVGERWKTVDGSQHYFTFEEKDCPTYGKDISQLRAAGCIDASGNLVAAHDAATAHLGAPWRIPTKEEFEALEKYCTSKWTECNGVPGRLVSGKGEFASKSIFLPAAGNGIGSYLYDTGSYGYYWSSTPYSDDSYCAWGLYFYSSYFSRYDRGRCRCYGQSVRPLRGFAE